VVWAKLTTLLATGVLLEFRKVTVMVTEATPSARCAGCERVTVERVAFTPVGVALCSDELEVSEGFRADTT
jgi:hypothetical protein